MRSLLAGIAKRFGFRVCVVASALAWQVTYAAPLTHYTQRPIPNRVVLLPLSVEVHEISAGGVVEEVPKLSEQATASVEKALKAFDALRERIEIVPLPDLSETERDIVAEHVALYKIIANTAHVLIESGGSAWDHKGERFDYTLGGGLEFLRGKAHADAGLIVTGTEFRGSTGRGVLAALSFVLAGAYVPMGGTAITAGFVDFATGDILWFNLRRGGDLIESDAADTALRDVLDAAPLSAIETSGGAATPRPAGDPE